MLDLRFKSGAFKLLFSLCILCCGITFAVETIPISRLPNRGYVRIHGKVTKIFDENKFLISDSSGSIVISTGDTSTYVPVGEEITITGNVTESVSLFSQYRQMEAQSIRRSSGKSISVH